MSFFKCKEIKNDSYQTLEGNLLIDYIFNKTYYSLTVTFISDNSYKTNMSFNIKSECHYFEDN